MLDVWPVSTFRDFTAGAISTRAMTRCLAPRPSGRPPPYPSHNQLGEGRRKLEEPGTHHPFLITAIMSWQKRLLFVVITKTKATGTIYPCDCQKVNKDDNFAMGVLLKSEQRGWWTIEAFIERYTTGVDSFSRRICHLLIHPDGVKAFVALNKSMIHPYIFGLFEPQVLKNWEWYCRFHMNPV